MPLRQTASGSVKSTSPPVVKVSLPLDGKDAVKPGQTASIQIKPPTIIPGKVTRVENSPASETITVDIELSEPLPADASVGVKVRALINVGELTDVVFFERPADARPNTESIIFVIEPDGQHAKRVAVRYGRQSGALMEIISGLSPGDRVIVTDMSAWSAHERVRLN